MLGDQPEDHDGADACRVESFFEIGADKGAMDTLLDDGLAGQRSHFILMLVAGLSFGEGRARLDGAMLDMKDGPLLFAPVPQQDAGILFRPGIVAFSAKGVQLIESFLDVDQDCEAGGDRQGLFP